MKQTPLFARALVRAVALVVATAWSFAAVADAYDDTIELFKNAGQSAAFFENSYGYAVFPTIAKGGLGVPTDEIGLISGIVGVVSLTLGGILGGFVIAKYGIKRCLWPMVLSLNIPNLFYVWAAFTNPGVKAVTWLIAVDQFGYGFGFSAYMVYLMFVAQGSRFETSHYAIATGLIASVIIANR